MAFTRWINRWTGAVIRTLSSHRHPSVAAANPTPTMASPTYPLSMTMSPSSTKRQRRVVGSLSLQMAALVLPIWVSATLHQILQDRASLQSLPQRKRSPSPPHCTSSALGSSTGSQRPSRHSRTQSWTLTVLSYRTTTARSVSQVAI